MGDVASSLFALGYHEKIEEATSNIPLFVAELRRTIFARVYAADKSLAIFLGRPPRVVKAFCTFHLPANLPGLWQTSGSDKTGAQTSDTSTSIVVNSDLVGQESINYTADTRCSARFALLKEEALKMFRNRHSQDQSDAAK